jgi:hypothetical protein
MAQRPAYDLAAAYAFFIMFSFWPHTAGQISYWADCFAEALIEYKTRKTG